MKKNGTIIFASCIALLMVGLLVFQALSSSNSRAASATNPSAESKEVQEVRGYKQWTPVNPKPVFMLPAVSVLCGMPSSRSTSLVSDESNPHLNKYITVYVNETGRGAMMTESKPKFPEGSVIVKEKLPKAEGGQPELLTVMIKREKGFNSESGDWEYMVLNGQGTKVDARGKLANCQSCHVTMPETDYVFRSYLPNEIRKNLR